MLKRFDISETKSGACLTRRGDLGRPFSSEKADTRKDRPVCGKDIKTEHKHTKARKNGKIWFPFLCMSFSALIGCSGFQQVAEPSSSAQAPVLIAVYTFPVQKGYRTNISPNSHGAYELPWTGGISVSFRAPWPSSIEVRVNSMVLPQVAVNVVSNAGLGSYRIIHPKVYDGNPIADWKIDIFPPQFARMQPFSIIEIRNLSFNPSPPLIIKISQPCSNVPVILRPLVETNLAGFTHIYNPATKSIEIWKGKTLIYSHVTASRDAWEVFYNELNPYEAIILVGRRQIYLIKLEEAQNSGQQIGSWVCM